jgi:hypothetical protein
VKWTGEQEEAELCAGRKPYARNPTSSLYSLGRGGSRPEAGVPQAIVDVLFYLLRGKCVSRHWFLPKSRQHG